MNIDCISLIGNWYPISRCEYDPNAVRIISRVEHVGKKQKHRSANTGSVKGPRSTETIKPNKTKLIFFLLECFETQNTLVLPLVLY